MSWILGIIAFLVFFFWRSGGMQPLLKVGPVEMDWRDILVLAIIVIGAWLVASHQVSGTDLLKILAGILAAQAVGQSAGAKR